MDARVRRRYSGPRVADRDLGDRRSGHPPFQAGSRCERRPAVSAKRTRALLSLSTDRFCGVETTMWVLVGVRW